jgi:hypothetical protein
LNCGKVFEREKKATFYVSKINDVKTILIPLFDKFPLNGTKYLDYLSFKEAIAIKFDESLSKSTKLKLITELKNNINTQRTDFVMPDTHSIRITPY